MQQRPVIKLKLSFFDLFAEVVALVLLLLLWIMILAGYSRLPETIPVHFNLSGTADGFGSKKEIFGSAAIATAIYQALSLLNKFPHKSNYLTTITTANALQQYTMGTRIIRILKILVISLFLATTYATMNP